MREHPKQKPNLRRAVPSLLLEATGYPDQSWYNAGGDSKKGYQVVENCWGHLGHWIPQMASPSSLPCSSHYLIRFSYHYFLMNHLHLNPVLKYCFCGTNLRLFAKSSMISSLSPSPTSPLANQCGVLNATAIIR